MVSKRCYVLLALALATTVLSTYFMVSSNARWEKSRLLQLAEQGGTMLRSGWSETKLDTPTPMGGEVEEILSTTSSRMEQKEGRKIEVVDDLLDRLVVLTAISDNHFRESQRNLPTMHKCLPNNKVILYDLGLNEKNRARILTQTYIELRRFPFASYEHLPHLKHLQSYAWKPIIVNEVAKEFDVILYVDASIRMVSCDPRMVLQYLFEFPLVARKILTYAIEFAADGMIEYLHYPKMRKDIANLLMYESSCVLLLVNSRSERFLKNWLDCALHQECIAPKGTSTSGCHMTKNHDGHFVGCHRYDQSALNLILAREFGAKFIDNFSNRTSSFFNDVWSMNRLK